MGTCQRCSADCHIFHRVVEHDRARALAVSQQLGANAARSKVWIMSATHADDERRGLCSLSICQGLPA
jgi:hypothetical protein